jgi:hypothetical protein
MLRIADEIVEVRGLIIWIEIVVVMDLLTLH